MESSGLFAKGSAMCLVGVIGMDFYPARPHHQFRNGTDFGVLNSKGKLRHLTRTAPTLREHRLPGLNTLYTRRGQCVVYPKKNPTLCPSILPLSRDFIPG